MKTRTKRVEYMFWKTKFKMAVLNALIIQNEILALKVMIKCFKRESYVLLCVYYALDI